MSEQQQKKPSFQTRDGRSVSADDPKRSVWYGMCGHWTDDWSLLKTETMNVTVTGPGGRKYRPQGPPLCPRCNAPGFIADFSGWWKSAEQYAESHPGYMDHMHQRRLARKDTP